MALERWIERQKRKGNDGGVEILTPAQLVEKTREELKRKFGEVIVAKPPALLTETQKVAEGEGFGFFEPLYLPAGEYKENSWYPRGWVNLESWYWQQIKAGRVEAEAATFPGMWTLFDRSKRPGYQGGKQMFEGDERLGSLLSVLRQEGRIAVPDFVKHVPAASRFAVSPDEQDQAVFPELARVLRLEEPVTSGEVIVRTPKAMEANFAGNLRYPHLGQANTAEWYADRFGGGDRLGGGGSGVGGLASVGCDGSGHHVGIVAFRPLVAFPPKF